MGSIKRIQKEYQDLIKKINSNSLEGINFSLINENDLYHCKASIKGKKGTPYEGGTFQIYIHMPSEYPFKPMKIGFITKIFHPCIDSYGTLCRCCFLPEICDYWSPAYSLEKILFILRERLYDENYNYELCVKNKNRDLLKLNRKKYNEITREYTKYYAIENHEEKSESFDLKIKNLIDIGYIEIGQKVNQNNLQINEMISESHNILYEDDNLVDNQYYKMISESYSNLSENNLINDLENL